MTEKHPIIPPPELVQQWWEEADQYQDDPKTYFDYVATEAAQWGADQELEACCKWLASLPNNWTSTALKRVSDLRAARRPKPPSLREESLKGFDTIAGIVLDEYSGTTFYEEYKKLTDTIRRALEQLDD